MNLLATADNPIPDGAVPVPVTTSDGLSLRAVIWPARAAPRGTVCILQGRAEFIEKYFETIGELLDRGFAVVTFDWRGQGGSAREVRNASKGHIGDFSAYDRDLEAIRAQILAPLMPSPHFALAHSMGGAVCLIAARENRLPFERLVALAPMIALRMVKYPRGAEILAATLTSLGLGKLFVPGGNAISIATKPFPGNRLTSDAGRYARNATVAAALGSGAIGDPTNGWLAAAFRAMARFEEPRFGLETRLPILIVAAGADPVCRTPAIERFAARLKAGHGIVLPGARHELLMERDAIRELFWAAFDAFVPGTGATAPRLPEADRQPAEEKPSAAEQGESRLVEPAVAGRDDGAALGRGPAVP